MLIRNDKFSGEFPKRTTRRRGDNTAEVALDCLIVSDSLRPINGPVVVPNVSTVNVNSVFEHDGVFFTWSEDVDAVETPIDSAIDRIFFTGLDTPRQATVEGLANDITYKLGLPAPPEKPILQSQVAVGTGDDINTFYVMTYTNIWGEESAQSEALEVTYKNGDGITVFGGRLGSLDLGSYGIVEWSLYRGAGDQSQLVEKVSIEQDTIFDNALTTVLGKTLDSLTNFPPPDNMIGLHVMSNGIALGFVKDTRKVVVSEPYNLNAWPYEFTVGSDVIAVSSYENTAVIGTKGYPEIATIVNPENIVPIRLNDREPCVSKRSMVQGANGVFYAAPTTLFYIGPGGARAMTIDMVDAQSWRALKPETFNAVYRSGAYMAFYSDSAQGGTWVFDTREENATIRRLSLWASAAVVGEGNDNLYYASENVLYQFDADNTKLMYRWESSEHGNGSPYAITSRRILSPDLAANPTPLELAAIREAEAAVAATREGEVATALALGVAVGVGGAVGQSMVAEYPVAGTDLPPLADPLEVASVKLCVYADRQLMHEEVITQEDEDRINYHDRARVWSYKLEGNIEITQVDLAGSISEMHTGS